MRHPRLGVLGLGLVVLLGCRDEPRSPVRERPVVEPAPILEHEDEPSPSAAWPTEVESLREAVDAFGSVEDCLASLRAGTPTAVAEGIADLAYDGFFDDVCRAMAAVKEGSVEGCDGLVISSARAGCRRRLALVHGRPEVCPEDRTIPGREALCVAWAARDRALCRASAEQARCRAVLEGDARACERLRGGDRERCRASVRRYHASVGETEDSPAARAPAVLTLEVRELGEDPITIERDVLARGVRLVPQGCRWAVALANPRGEPSLGLVFDAEPRFHLELAVAADVEPGATLALGGDEAVLSLFTPSLGPLTSISGAEGHVRLERFEPRLGGAIVGRVTGSLRHGTRRVSVRGRFATFVRDLDRLPERCTP